MFVIQQEEVRIAKSILEAQAENVHQIDSENKVVVRLATGDQNIGQTFFLPRWVYQTLIKRKISSEENFFSVAK